jgi:myosin heavy subunit
VIGERNYHVFYQLLSATQANEYADLNLTTSTDYRILNQSSCTTFDDANDYENYRTLKNSLITIGFTEMNIHGLFRIIAGILNLSNIEFIEMDTPEGAAASLSNDVPLQQAATVLGLDATALFNTLTQRQMLTRGNRCRSCFQ